MDVVFIGKAFSGLGLVLVHAAHEIVGNANVQRSAELACEDIDPIAA